MKYIKRLFGKNVRLKLLALAMSLVACVSVHVLTTPTRDDTISHRVYTLPIKFTAPSDNLIYSADEKEVVVTVRGPMVVLNRISPELLSAEVDLSARLHPGNAVETINVRTPNGVTITSVTPSYTWVRVSNRLAKQIPVRVSLQGQVKSGYSVGTPEVYPPTAQVSGSEDSVEQVTELRAPVVVSDVSESMSIAARTLVPIDRLGEMVEDVTVNNPHIVVTVPVYALAQASVNIRNIHVKAAGDVTYTLSVEPKNILLETKGAQGKDLSEVNVEPRTVNVGRQPEVISVPLVLPSGATLASGPPNSVTITVTPREKTRSERGHNSGVKPK